MISLMPISSASLAQAPVKAINISPDFSCLTQQQKQRVDACFVENFQCHLTLERIVKPPINWENLALVAVSSLVVGVVLDHQLSR
jgi:hypothetical protein